MSDDGGAAQVPAGARKIAMSLVAVAPAFAAVGVLATIVWWAAVVSIGLDRLDSDVFKINSRLGNFDSIEWESRLDDLENPILPFDTESGEVRSLRLDLVSAEAEIDRLRERTASLATRLTTLERSQNADSMKHEGAATALATLTERINMMAYYRGAAPEPSDDRSERQ